jgi:hypothetical protein
MEVQAGPLAETLGTNAALETLNAVVAVALWGCAEALRLASLLRCCHRGFSWFLYARHPIVQIGYLGILLGAFGAFRAHGFPLVDAGQNPYFGPARIPEAYALLAATLAAFFAACFCDPGVVTGENAAGYVALSRVQRGVALSCSLGYWAGAPHARRGHTSAAVRRLVVKSSPLRFSEAKTCM